ncbi:heavy metal-binding domain-containing protein [Adhaeribacter terreus]|uniref:Heavy metal-binding domain-containing protein n=1 Tax=Adhaeribacter terreus TaxID=529703 RepID=A0ABW0ECP4_9BACT
MKIKNIFSALALVLSLAGFAACTEQTSKETTETTRKVTDKAYTCPMHCEGSASNEPGKCPVCEMDLEKNPDYVPPVSPSADITQEGTIADTAATK